MRKGEKTHKAPIYIKSMRKRGSAGSENENIRKSAARYARMSTPSGTEVHTSLSQVQNSSDTTQQWPGPFATARDMINKRQAALEARLSRLNDGEYKIEEDEEDLDDYEKSLRSVTVKNWKPPSNSSSFSFSCHNIAHNGNPIKRLDDICIDLLAQHFDRVEVPEELPDIARAKLALELSRFRRLNAEAVLKIACSPASSLEIPDCSSVSEESLMSAIEVTAGLRSIYREGNNHGTDKNNNRYHDHYHDDANWKSSDSTISLKTLKLFNCGHGFTTKTASLCLKIASVFTTLKLVGCYRIHDDVLSRLLKECTQLQSLDLSYCYHMSNQSLESLKFLNNLNELTLDNILNLENEDFNILCDSLSNNKIRKLSLEGTCIEDTNMIKLLENHGSYLEFINLSHTSSLTDETLVGVRKYCSNLQHLNISKMNVTKVGVLGLFLEDKSSNDSRSNSSIGMLKSLCFDWLECVDDDIIVEVAKSTAGNLRDLFIGNCKEITGKAIMALKMHSASTLQYLDLSFARQIHENALGVLVEECNQLRKLTLWGWTDLSKQFLIYVRTLCEVEGAYQPKII
jgi:DNA repair protein RAD7